jgi:hypothetical protein
MLARIGAPSAALGPREMLAACHGRIRAHLVLARRLAHAPSAATAAEITSTATQVGRFFAEALPLHVLDEELALAPLLLPPDELAADAAALPHALRGEAEPTHALRLVAGPSLASAPGGAARSRIDRMAREHAEHAPLLAHLCAICARVAIAPGALAERAELARVVDALAPLLAEHLDFEERALFPRVDALPAAVRDQLAAAMRARRAPPA